MKHKTLITSVVLLVAALPPLFTNVYAQNFTNHTKTDPALQICPNGQTLEQGGLPGISCNQAIQVLFDSENLLVIESDYIDIIWDAVHDAMKLGYRIQDVQTYAAESSSVPLTIRIMVILTK